MPQVQVIQPIQQQPKRLRVAAYARVSTDDEEQQTSYEAQVDYYTKKIRENPEWIFVEVYADEGITGTSTKRRKNFNRMIDDAMAGRIDRIITKSVSRFARNTVDTLTTVRKLKEKGVGVTHACGKGDVAGQHGKVHPEQREVQRRRTVAKDLHRGLPDKEGQSERRRSAPILRRKQPPGYRQRGGVRACPS